IIHIAITGPSAIFEYHFPYVHAGPVTIEYGTPIYPSELPREDQKNLGRYVQRIIREMLQKQQQSATKNSL
ncbi:MAG: 1-acyl-sn-glycerol-3-phosphate acyltransferase, partial [Clostridiales bacterium]|nr:1-acyl-sn-glycerol-3-phosphate acyltransferase [Clostridiales bacterium]